jgi:hypothetical protein
MSRRDEIVKRFRTLAPAVAAIVVVIVAYVWFASGGFANMRRFVTEDGSYFSSLAEGFRHGHVYMMKTPDPRLVALRDPYDPASREGINYLWDASFYKGRYYLYFSAVPVLFFYLPYRIVFGLYPPDLLATVVFGIWAFLATVLALWRALRMRNASEGERTCVPVSLWVLLVGLSTLVPFQFAEIRIYEVSVFAGAAMTASWSYALVRMTERPTTARVLWMSFWLAMAIAARPNLGVLLAVAALGIYFATENRKALVRAVGIALIPLGIVFLLLLAYNAGRFGKPKEFGHRYQLTAVSMKGKSVCRLCNLSDVSRLGNSMMHYVFWPLSIRTTFPLLKVERADLDPAVSFPGSEEVIGVAPIVPLSLVATVLAAILALTADRRNLRTSIGLWFMLAAWLIILGLSTCWFVVARYETDFMLLLVAATALCIEEGLAFLRSAGVRVLPLRIATLVLVCYSIGIGLLLGFVGREEAFRRFNPDAFYRVAHFLGMTGF